MNHLETGLQTAAAVADAAIAKPSSPNTNAGLVWNGSAWVAALLVNGNIDPAANIAYSKLTLAGSVVNNDIANGAAIAYSKLSLTGGIVNSDISASAAIANSKLAIPLITTSTLAGGPPGSPSDKDIWIATAVDANGTRWTFQYNAGSGSASKWEFIGGSPLVSMVATDETTSSATYAALTTAGPSITLARAGDYDVTIECNQQQDGGTGKSFMSYDIGGTSAVDGDAAFMNNPGSAVGMNFTTKRTQRKTGLSAATTLTAKYRTASGGQMHAGNRAMIVTPVRIA